MKLPINNEMAKKFGVGAIKVGKAIVWEGIKGVLLKSVTNAITTSFDSGIEGVKKMTIDDYVGKKKKKLIEVPKVKVESEKDRITVDAEFVPVEKQEQD